MLTVKSAIELALALIKFSNYILRFVERSEYREFADAGS